LHIIQSSIIISGASVTSTEQFCASTVLYCIVLNEKVQRCRGHQWHNVHWSTSSKFGRGKHTHRQYGNLI